MEEETNNNIPGDSERKLPISLDVHLRAIMKETDLKDFHKQLPAEFLSDASEGLLHVNDTKQLESVLQQLNQQMHQHLQHKKTHKRTHHIGNLSWTYWAIIVILLLSITGFIIIRMLLHR
jgi:hypothetical protein